VYEDAPRTAYTRLRDGAEFDLIRRFLSIWGDSAVAIGDDAALLPTIQEGHLAWTIDTSVENVHFRRRWLTPTEIGYRATASALSDLAAMAAAPIGIVSAVVLPSDWADEAGQIAEGMADAARACGAKIVGGDLSAGRELSITISALGAARQPLLRSTAHGGDLVYVTGRLGGPAAALRALAAEASPHPKHRERFARPVPRINEAIWLGKHGISACIDVSDGLTADLEQIAAASDVAISVDLELIPAMEGVSPLEAAGSGEEYELAITSSTEIDITEFEQAFGLELTRIGTVVDGSAQVTLLDRGTEVALPPGYLHFSK
jgi:thiamine-monophosphate kinase